MITLLDGLRGVQSRYAVTNPPRSPCWSKNRYVLNSDGRKKSDGAPQVSQSEDWITSIRWRAVSPAGVSTRAYDRNAVTDWNYERDFLNRVSYGVLRVIGAVQQASWSTLLEYSIGSRITAQIRMEYQLL